MDPQNSGFPRSKAEKWVSLTNNSKHIPSFLLRASGLKSLQSVHFLGIYVPSQGNKVFLYSLQMRGTSLLDERICLLKETEFEDHLL